MSFTDGESWIATEVDCGRAWSGGSKGKYFRCYFCGHKFKSGDTVRWQFTNDIAGAGGNPLVCLKCDDGPEKVIEKWKQMHKEYRDDKWWWFRRHKL